MRLTLILLLASLSTTTLAQNKRVIDYYQQALSDYQQAITDLKAAHAEIQKIRPRKVYIKHHQPLFIDRCFFKEPTSMESA
jgi:ABC-type transporter MlaC component